MRACWPYLDFLPCVHDNRSSLSLMVDFFSFESFFFYVLSSTEKKGGEKRMKRLSRHMRKFLSERCCNHKWML